MAAVVRVKRRINEEPLSAFVLNCKKRKLENGANPSISEEEQNVIASGSKDEVSTVLKFAGTVESQQDPITSSQITRLTKEEAKNIVQKVRNPNPTEKSRQERRQNAQESRFRVVNCSRALDTSSTEAASSEITIVDIEKHGVGEDQAVPSSSGTAVEPMQTFAPTDSDGYVYDLYVPENDQQLYDFDYTDNTLSVRPIDLDLVYGDCYNDDDEDYDSEDSNREDNAGNEYPDEDDDCYDQDSINDDDIIRAVQDCHLDVDGDRELSSDDDNDFVYSMNTEDYGFDDSMDDDADRYGPAYANYKARVMNKARKYDTDSDSSEEFKSDCSD